MSLKYEPSSEPLHISVLKLRSVPQIPFTRVYARALSVNGFDRVRIVMSDAGAGLPLNPATETFKPCD